MNAGAVAERVHEALRRRILAHGFRPGDRLDPAMLAAELAASATPVREALFRLTGEGLVELRANGGFHLPPLDEPGLRDLYGWSNELLVLALRHARPPAAIAPPEIADLERSGAERTASLFQAIGDRSRNREHGAAIAAINRRLHAVRIVEPQILAGIDGELRTIAAQATIGQERSLRRLIAAFHRRRQRAAAQIVRAMYWRG